MLGSAWNLEILQVYYCQQNDEVKRQYNNTNRMRSNKQCDLASNKAVMLAEREYKYYVYYLLMVTIVINYCFIYKYREQNPQKYDWNV
jgi:hypothetical protein